MRDILGYDGASVVVSGAASGMGAATAQILVDLGARVTALDIKPTAVPVARSLEVDLRDRAAIEATAAAIDGPVDGLFSCAGLPGPPFSELDTMKVNFVGARHLAEQLVPKMRAASAISAISSSAAVGRWDQMAMLGSRQRGARGGPMNKDDLILVSVDDHVVEPPDVFEDHLPAKYQEFAPKLKELDDGGPLDGSRKPRCGRARHRRDVEDGDGTLKADRPAPRAGRHHPTERGGHL